MHLRHHSCWSVDHGPSPAPPSLCPENAAAPAPRHQTRALGDSRCLPVLTSCTPCPVLPGLGLHPSFFCFAMAIASTQARIWHFGRLLLGGRFPEMSLAFQHPRLPVVGTPSVALPLCLQCSLQGPGRRGTWEGGEGLGTVGQCLEAGPGKPTAWRAHLRRCFPISETPQLLSPLVLPSKQKRPNIPICFLRNVLWQRIRSPLMPLQPCLDFKYL